MSFCEPCTKAADNGDHGYFHHVVHYGCLNTCTCMHRVGEWNKMYTVPKPGSDEDKR